MQRTPKIPIRLLLAGHSGVDKRRIVERISHALKADGKHVHVVHLEDDKMLSFFAQTPNSADQRDRLRALARRAVEEIRRAPSNADLIILTMHLTYFTRGLILQPASWNFTEAGSNEVEPILFKYITDEYAPHYVASIIDDIQAAHQSVKAAGITLKDLLRWRNAETYTADTLANLVHFSGPTPKTTMQSGGTLNILRRYPYEFSPVFAARNDLRAFTRYFFQPELPRIYSSFPISRPRKSVNSAQLIKEINTHNEWLCDRFAVFNPAAIDELPLVVALKDFLEEKGRRQLALDDQLTIEADQHWPLRWQSTICGKARSSVTLYVKEIFDISARLYRQASTAPPSDLAPQGANTIPKQMLRLIDDDHARSPGRSIFGKSDLDYQVEERDLRMIDQSDIVVMYRPTLNSRREEYDDPWTGGTQEEYRYAHGVGKEVIVVMDENDDLHPDKTKLGLTVPSYRILGGDLRNAAKRKALYRQLEEMIRKTTKDAAQERASETKRLIDLLPNPLVGRPASTATARRSSKVDRSAKVVEAHQ